MHQIRGQSNSNYGVVPKKDWVLVPFRQRILTFAAAIGHGKDNSIEGRKTGEQSSPIHGGTPAIAQHIKQTLPLLIPRTRMSKVAGRGEVEKDSAARGQ